MKGLLDSGGSDLKGLGQFLQHPIEGLNGIKQLLTDAEARGQLTQETKAELNAKIDRIETALTVGGDQNAEQLGQDLGSLIWQAGTVATGVGGAAKAGVKLAEVGISVGSKGLEAMKIATSLLKADAKGLGGVVKLDEIGMQFGKGIEGQGKPFEAYVQSKLPAGTIDLNSIKTNFSTFDHLTPDGTAISTKTLDTVGSSTYQNPAKITSTLNGYVDQMVSFVRDGKGTRQITSDMITAKQMQLAIPEGTSVEQMAAIAKSIQYARNWGIQIIVTKMK